MKIRLSNEKERAERDENDRRERILTDKEKRTIPNPYPTHNLQFIEL